MTPVEVSEIVRNYALVAAAVGGGAIAIWRALTADRQSRAQRDQVRQSRREHVAEVFGNAVTNLDNEKLHVRLGAIYTFEGDRGSLSRPFAPDRRPADRLSRASRLSE